SRVGILEQCATARRVTVRLHHRVERFVEARRLHRVTAPVDGGTNRLRQLVDGGGRARHDCRVAILETIFLHPSNPGCGVFNRAPPCEWMVEARREETAAHAIAGGGPSHRAEEKRDVLGVEGVWPCGGETPRADPPARPG